MAVVDFLNNKHDVEVLFFHHGNSFSYDEHAFVVAYFETHNIPVHIGYMPRERDKSESREEFWRTERYKYLNQFTDAPVITCHHLDDCVETWIWSSLNGEGKIIPYNNGNVIRPFRLNRKAEFENWCRIRNIPWIEDASNQETRFMRNFIRHEIMPKVLAVNPGIHKVIGKKVKEDGSKKP